MSDTPEPSSVSCSDLFGPLWYKLHRAMGLIGEAMGQLDSLRESLESKDAPDECSQETVSTASGAGSAAQEQGQKSQSPTVRVNFQGPHGEGQLVLSARNFEVYKQWCSLGGQPCEAVPKEEEAPDTGQSQLSEEQSELVSCGVAAGSSVARTEPHRRGGEKTTPEERAKKLEEAVAEVHETVFGAALSSATTSKTP